ncbi:hypothetical protein F5Y06DRAFT_298715 [Hypoxylon sp. FL0890]|nr:hypothetical protein F5Y06DRAFT_298715 [Hypoxylon sp. FL0890]
MDTGLIKPPKDSRSELNTNEEADATTTSHNAISHQEISGEPELHIINIEGDIELNSNFEDEFYVEYFPLYTPSMLPPYSPYNSAELLPGVSPVGQREHGEYEPEDTISEEIPQRELNPQESTPRKVALGGNVLAEYINGGTHEIANNEDVRGGNRIDEPWHEREVGRSSSLVLHTFSSRIERKLYKVKQKLARGLETITAKKALSRAQGIKKIIRQK